MEHNPTIDKSGKLEGSISGMEDLSSSFYHPGKTNDELEGNRDRGGPLHGGFTSLEFQPEFDDVRAGFWANIGLREGRLTIPGIGLNRVGGECLIKGAKITTEAICYIDPNQPFP